MLHKTKNCPSWHVWIHNSFWKSKYQKNIKFLEKNYDKFGNNKYIQDLFEKMFEFDPIKRIKAKDIENHKWLVDMHSHKDISLQHVYESELQHLSHMTTIAKQAENNIMKQTFDNIESLYNSNSNNMNNNYNSNNSNKSVHNVMNIGYSDTQPSNEFESSVVFSTYDEVMNKLKNQTNNQGSDQGSNQGNNQSINDGHDQDNHEKDKDKDKNKNTSIQKVLRKMSDNTRNYVESRRKSTDANK